MTNTMDKILITLLIAALFFTMCFIVGAQAEGQHELYPTAGIVCNVDHLADMVYIVTFDGQEWAYGGAEDWAVGDIIAMVMDNMGTELIYDDEIVAVNYLGWVEW